MRAQGIVLGKKTPTYRKPTTLPRDLKIIPSMIPLSNKWAKWGKRVRAHPIKHGSNQRAPRILSPPKHRYVSNQEALASHFTPWHLETFAIPKPIQLKGGNHRYKGVGKGGI